MATRFQGVHGRPPAGPIAPPMVAAKAPPSHRILSAAQQARRKKRQAEGITDVRTATSDQLDQARSEGLLPTRVLLELQRKREQRQSNAEARAGATDLTGAVPPGTPHAVQQANALQQGPKALDPATLAYHRRRRKGGPAGGKPGMGQYPLGSA